MRDLCRFTCLVRRFSGLHAIWYTKSRSDRALHSQTGYSDFALASGQRSSLQMNAQANFYPTRANHPLPPASHLSQLD
ncbi:uncharacterized protein SCHCODRAFT_02636916 [Schizophyllum commune H4-8]|uniref:uncharacterized protein n=1 Tax=Schizophyllum commune (strain H4-8 / FGSC 9210) TaxID=578458 RepID=UPI00215ED382|nr:uncharacterized protein SCHCODRAFT_02636916 [Schizophyllum commune H4-8]KAI5888511.1 hypothetical protein SCHCODRAFT_02636916 [Schizophyllum commune H4-8]